VKPPRTVDSLTTGASRRGSIPVVSDLHHFGKEDILSAKDNAEGVEGVTDRHIKICPVRRSCPGWNRVRVSVTDVSEETRRKMRVGELN